MPFISYTWHTLDREGLSLGCLGILQIFASAAKALLEEIGTQWLIEAYAS